MPQQADLIGSLEASQLLDVNVATLNRWVVQGKITALVIPGRTNPNLYRRADIHALAKTRAADKMRAARAATRKAAA